MLLDRRGQGGAVVFMDASASRHAKTGEGAGLSEREADMSVCV